MARTSTSMPNVNARDHRPSYADLMATHSASRLSQRANLSVDMDTQPLHIQKLAPFNMRWIHGYNHAAGVYNLNNHGSTCAFYAASNCGVLYNWTTHQMEILQGHKHMVTCLAKDSEGQWIVTADSGPDNILIIWNHEQLYPQRTLFSPHAANRIAKVALSADAKYLITVAPIADKLDFYDIYWWIWSLGLDVPHATMQLSLARDIVAELAFNPVMSEQFLLLSRHGIWIGISRKIIEVERGIARETDSYELKINQLELNVPIQDMHERLMCHAFVENTSQIFVGTSRGSVMIFGYTMEYNDKVKHTAADYEDLKFIKEIKIEKWRIHVVKSIDNIIVTGNSHGELHFYDDQLKLLYWLHGLPIDGIKQLSFNISARSYQLFDTKCKKACLCWERVEAMKDPETGKMKQKLLLSKIPYDATTAGKPFIVRDFLIATINQGVCFMDFVTEKLTTIMDNRVSSVLSITVHPTKPLICMGFTDGTVQMYNIVHRKPMKRLNLRQHFTVVIPAKEDSINFTVEIDVPELSVTCIKYSPSGMHLVCGMNTGELIFLDPNTIDLIDGRQTYKDTSYAIQKVSYSIDSLSMATADDGNTVCVYKFNCDEFEWVFIGKHRAHYKGITNLMFLPEKNMGGDFKLLSIGKDRIMVEYDIGASDEEYLEILSLDRIDQSAIPLAAIEWPMPKGLDPEEYRTDLPLILIATDEYKYKILNYSTTMTLSTVLGPRYENPVSKMQLVKKHEGDEELHYLIFATRDVIGLQKLPLDGNPYKHIGMLGHPTKILDMCYREDLGIMFTIGEKDTSLTHWAANFSAVDTSIQAGGVDLDPYYCLFEDMRPGWLFQEIRDLFYYIQILCQGTFSPAIRHVRDNIPIDSLPDLMRALGFFPSEYAVENLIVEAKFKVYLRAPVAEIDFDEFVKLYLNHRPAFGESFKRIRLAFKNFADIVKENYVMPREEFIEMLSTNGECFSRELTWYLLSILSGHSFEERALMTEGDFSFLPAEITFSDLVNDIIGMQEMEDISETSCSNVSLVSRMTYDSEVSVDRFGKVFW